MRILVTGGTGFIGTHTVRALRAAGHDVKLLVRNEEKARKLWQDDPAVLEDLVVGKLTSGPATADALLSNPVWRGARARKCSITMLCATANR